MRPPLVLVLLVLAGCMAPEAPVDPVPGPVGCEPQSLQEPSSAPGFDGDAALAWVDAIVYEGDALRPRIPESLGHPCTADWLERTLQVEGWDVTRASFSAQEYIDLPKGSAAFWQDSCGSDDKAALQNFTFHNLIAVRPGGDQTLLLGAHWDAKEDANGGGVVPAANDGASGMGLLLELQRHLNSLADLPYTVAIVFFDGEDGFNDCHPLAGSIHFAATMPIEVDRMILLDMIGDIDARFPREHFSQQSDPALVDLIWSKAPDHGLEEQFTDTVKSVVDDHRPFIEADVPAVDIIDFNRPGSQFPPYWHTTQDTPDKLSADMLERMGELLIDVMYDPSFVDDWP